MQHTYYISMIHFSHCAVRIQNFEAHIMFYVYKQVELMNAVPFGNAHHQYDGVL